MSMNGICFYLGIVMIPPALLINSTSDAESKYNGKVLEIEPARFDLIIINARGALSTLEGTAGFAIENLRLKGAAYDQLATDTVAWFLTGGVLNAETRFSCILGSFDISDGTVKSQALFAESEYMIANGEASFDLQELVADIIITPQSKQRVFQIPGNIEVHGPLNDLSIYTSPVTTGVDTAVQAVTIAPQLAFSLFDKTARVLTGGDKKTVSKELNPCQKAVAVVR